MSTAAQPETAEPTSTTTKSQDRIADVIDATSVQSVIVGKENASILTLESEKDPDETCPKCHTHDDWGTSSWCPKCGYYPGVSEACPQQAGNSEQPDAEMYETEADSDQPPPMIASWVLQIIWINTGLFVASIAARYYFTYFDNSFRGLSGLIILFIGFLLASFNHIRAALEAMQKNVDLGPLDVLGSPIEMWRPTLAGLPQNAGRLIWGTVGLSAMICGGLVIGGIDISEAFKHKEPPPKKPDVLKNMVSQAVKEAPKDDQPETIEEALEQVATLEEIGDIPLPEPGAPITCVVYGFMRDGEDDFGRILLAAEIGGKRRHVATMPASAFPISSREILAARLEPLIVEQSSVDTQYRATWVRPTIGLRVEFSGWSVLGEMNDPTLAPRSSKNQPPPLEPIR